MNVATSESFGNSGLESSEVLIYALAEGFQGLKARSSHNGMNAHTLIRAMVYGAEDGSLPRRRIDRRFPSPGVKDVASYGWPPYKWGVAHVGGSRGGSRF